MVPQLLEFEAEDCASLSAVSTLLLSVEVWSSITSSLAEFVNCSEPEIVSEKRHFLMHNYNIVAAMSALLIVPRSLHPILLQ